MECYNFMLWMFMDSSEFLCWICLKLVSGGIPGLHQHVINCMVEMDKQKVDALKAIPKHYSTAEVQIVQKEIEKYIHKFTGPGNNYPARSIIVALRSHYHIGYHMRPDYQMMPLPRQQQQQSQNNNNDNDDDDPTRNLTDELNRLDDDDNDIDEHINEVNPADTRTPKLNY